MAVDSCTITYNDGLQISANAKFAKMNLIQRVLGGKRSGQPRRTNTYINEKRTGCFVICGRLPLFWAKRRWGFFLGNRGRAGVRGGFERMGLRLCELPARGALDFSFR